MNKTEAKAKRWLSRQSIEVEFNNRRSPDFITPDGIGYEVKLLRQNTITFYPSQVQQLKELETCTILVFNDGDAPIIQIPFKELTIPGYYGKIHIALVSFDQVLAPGQVPVRVSINEELWRWAKAQALLNNKTVGEIVEDALRKLKEA